MDKFDVAIVGAGPAGATAAYLLAQAGLQVVNAAAQNEAAQRSLDAQEASHVVALRDEADPRNADRGAGRRSGPVVPPGDPFSRR